MTQVVLTGQLVCTSDEEVTCVLQHLPCHVEQTLAEGGCLSFAVRQTDDPRVWQVDETFRDAEAFDAHQTRVASSEWGRATAGIERRYEVRGL